MHSSPVWLETGKRGACLFLQCAHSGSAFYKPRGFIPGLNEAAAPLFTVTTDSLKGKVRQMSFDLLLATCLCLCRQAKHSYDLFSVPVDTSLSCMTPSLLRLVRLATVQANSSRVLAIDYITIFLGWTNTAWPDSAVYDFSVWRLKRSVSSYTTFMKPVRSDTFVSILSCSACHATQRSTFPIPCQSVLPYGIFFVDALHGILTWYSGLLYR
jgi:hypothetical protein